MIHTQPINPLAPQFRVLSDAQCEEIVQATLECMERIGVMVMNAEARRLLEKAGARIQEKTAYIPAHLVHQALASTPRAFKIYGRDGSPAITAEPGRVHFGPGPTCTYFIDQETGERRKARRGDAALVAKLVDALPNLSYIMGLSLFDDVTPVLAPVYEFAEEITNTKKPILAWSNNQETFDDIYAIAAAVAGGEESLRQRPIFALFATYESPLRLANDPLANLLRAVEKGIPAVLLGGPTVGLESPFYGASSLVIYLATALTGLLILQLKRPGAAVMIGGVPSSMDLRTARPSYGSPEMSLNTAAAAELAHSLHLPFMGTAGATESKLLDAQAGIEATHQILLSALSGASLVHDMGFLDCADIGSPAYLVLLDEVVGLVARILRGIPVNRETLMLDLIEQVGPGGTFLTEPRSAVLCRSEVWVPTVLDRATYMHWESKGRLSTADRVQAKLRNILREHQVEPLAAPVQAQIEAILQAAERRYH